MLPDEQTAIKHMAIQNEVGKGVINEKRVTKY